MTTGNTYVFKIEAHTSYGYSDYSDSLSLLMATVPDQVSIPVTSNLNADIIITWSAPFANSDPITGYRIEIFQKDLSYSEDLTNCDGSAAGIVSATTCTIPYTVLIATPFSLIQGDEVYARVYAINSYGDSEVSLDGNGAIIEVVPAAPVNLQMLDTTSVTQISLDWDKGHTNGGSSIIDYRVSYDQAADDWIELEENILTQ
jgi:hypothetical protein